MSEVEAVYQDGVFKPLEEVNLPENQRVRLTVSPARSVDPDDMRAWLSRVEEMRERIAAERGLFPDSTIDIAEDRAR